MTGASGANEGKPGQASEAAFLGALLGLAIGDALGMPAGNGAMDLSDRVAGYLPLDLPDGTRVDAGEFTDETEFALSIAEVATTNRGRLDADLIGPRLLRLAEGAAAHWQAPATRQALLRAGESLEFRQPLDEDGPVDAAVAVRGVPVGLVHSLGALDLAALREDSDLVSRITHGSPAQSSAALAVAFVTQLAARQQAPPDEWVAATASVLAGGAMHDALCRTAADDGAADRVHPPAAEEQIRFAIQAAAGADDFEDAVLRAVNGPGKADTVGAMTGALAGARFGAEGIPQPLIDGLGGRIYVSLAAPWLRRAAQFRADLILDLPTDGPPPPRPLFPPRQ